MRKRIRVKRTVERTKDTTSGLWWVRKEGKRERGFTTREAARIYKASPASSTGRNQGYLLALVSIFGIKKVNQTFAKLGGHEALTLQYTLEGFGQQEIAKTLGVTQPTINYLLRRGMERVTFILNRPGLDIPKLRVDLIALGLEPTDIDLTALYLETTCQSDVAKKLGVTQGFVRYRLLRTREALAGGAQNDPEIYGQHLTLLDGALENTNILHPVPRIRD